MKLPYLAAICIALSLLAPLANGRADNSPNSGTTTAATTAPVATPAPAPATTTAAAPPSAVSTAPPPHIVGVIPAPARPTSTQTSTAPITPKTTAHDDAKAQAKRDQDEATRIARQQLREAEDMADATMAREAAAGSNSSSTEDSDAPTPEQIQAQTTVRHYTMGNMVSESHSLNPPPDATHHSMYNFF